MYQSAVVKSWWSHISPSIYGHQNCPAGHTYGPYSREYYLIHYVHSGSGRFFTGGENYTLQTGDLFIIHPGEVTVYSASHDDPWSYSWLGFYLDEPQALLPVSVIRQAPVREIFEAIRDYERWDSPNSPDGEIYSLTYSLLHRLNCSAAPTEDRINHYASYLKAYLDASYMLPISMQEISDQMHVNRRYLTSLFRAAYGVPPKEYLTHLRLHKSMEFLSAGHSVSDSASMAGFPDLPNFSRQFKRSFGCNPSQIKHKDGEAR